MMPTRGRGWGRLSITCGTCGITSTFYSHMWHDCVNRVEIDTSPLPFCIPSLFYGENNNSTLVAIELYS